MPGSSTTVWKSTLVSLLGAVFFFCILPSASQAQISTFPYSQSFETGATYGPWGTWTQGPATSNPRWQRRSGSTGSANTGPSGAHDGSWYIYFETSGGSTGSTDYVTGNFNLSSLTSPFISFYYHMFGTTTGTLAVEASLDNGANWIEFWSKSGQQHTSSAANWTKDSVSLCALSGFSNVLIRFKAVRGTSFTGDLAIDLVTVYDGPTNPAAYVSSTTTQNNTTPVGTGLGNQEVIGVEIDVTGDCPPIPVTSFTFNTTGSTNASSDITAARLWYSGPSDEFATAVQFGSTVSNPSGNFTFSGDTIGVSGGTNYFWLTYDIDANATAGNVIDAQCTAIIADDTTRTPTVTNPTGSRSIIAALNGVYTIDANGTGSRNFTSFGDALFALDAAGVAGAVTFQVAAGTYNEQLVFEEVLGASSTNTITFDGGTGNASSRIISYSVNTTYGSVITLDGADYFAFKNLTVNSTGTYGYGFLFTNQANDNEISNCVINMPTNTTSTYHIGILASNAGSYTAYGDWGNNNLIKDNVINSGYYGIRWNGYNNTSNVTIGYGNQFIGNTIQNFYYYGIYSYYSVATKINENTIVQRRSGSTTTAGYGLYVYYANLGPEVIGNYVHTNNYPLRVYYANRNYTSAGISNAARGKVINNMFVLEHTSTSTIYGMYVYYPSYTDIGFNSLYMKTTTGTGTVYGLYQYGTSLNHNNHTANNIISYDGSRSTFYGIYNNSTNGIASFDYNMYWRYNPGTTTYRWSASNRTSLAALKAAASGYHQNSVEGNPFFVSETDLHSRSHVGYQAGIPFAGVTDDFDGDTRSASVPSIGADEYPAPPPENDMAVSQVMLAHPDGKWAHREDPDEHDVVVVLENIGLSDNPTSVTVTYKLGSMPSNVNDGVQQTFNPGWVGQKAVETFTQRVSGLSPGPISVHARVFWGPDEDAGNDAASDNNVIVEIEKVHGVETFDKMNPGIYPLTRDPGFLDLPWTITDNNGGATLEVMPGMGVGGSQALSMMQPGEAADEWLITPGADLLGYASYRLDFDFSNLGGSPVTIEAAFGTSPDPSQMTVFATFADIGPGAFLTAKQLAGGMSPFFNTPVMSTTYYVGLRFTTSGTNAQFTIDNIKLDDNPSPPPKIAFGLPGEDLSTYIDSPDEMITVMANYKQAGMIERTYEVQSSTNIYGTNGDFLWDVETQTPWITLTKETPDPTLQGYNLIPARARQYQTFTMTVNPSGLAPGVHHGEITFYGILFNDDFPPPANGLVATNEPLTITVELRIVDAGSKTGPAYIEASYAMPLTVPGSPYQFIDPQSGHPIATVEVTSGQIDAMTIRAYPKQLPQNITRMLYVERYWQITHSGTGWTADITFPYSDQEAGMVFDKSQLRSVRQAVPFGPWEDPTVGTTSASDPARNTVRVNGFTPANIGGNLALAHPYFMMVKEGAGIPQAFGLEQNYPNPFNPSTTISFSVAEERHVRVAVYNNLGMEVAELVSDMLPAGRYDVRFDATDLPSGTYLYRMTAGDFVQTQRMTLSK